MSHIFRLYKGNNTITDWQQSVAYGPKAIEEIQDPDGASVHKEITSIPSPFARIDLVKTAFDFVVKQKELSGNTIFHKMVSETLDIAQIFFNYPILKNKVKIIVWDARQQVDMELLQSNESEHKVVGQTLAMFMNQDKSTYNFSEDQRFFLLQYIGKYRKSQMDIIGSTSPATLFFSSANNLSYISDDIQFGQDKVFDDEYTPLSKRDEDFIVYMFTYRKFYPQFSKIFREVDEYMNLVYKEISPKTRDKIDNFTSADIENYPKLTISTVVTTDKVEINGIPFHHMAETPIKSGFEINSTLQTNCKPLVLPVQSGSLYKDIYYVRDIWGIENKAPFDDIDPIIERRLPNEGRIYPYLTISDFLEKTLIKIPYEIDKENYFDGNSNTKGESYLLPLTDTFFQYFTTDELMRNINGKPMLELQKNAGGVKVVLRIPIQNNRYIEYERIYFEDTLPDIEKNKGGLVEKEFAFGLLTNIKYKEDKDAYYRAIIVYKFKENEQYSIVFYNGDKRLNLPTPIIRNKSYKNYQTYQTYIVEKKNFTYCSLQCKEGYKGIIIPIFKQQDGYEQYTFSIDFGTTNTHVEYSINGLPAIPFEIEKTDRQIKLFATDYLPDSENIIFNDFIPNAIGNGKLCHFPTRTVLSEGKDSNWNQSIYPLGNVNISYYYDKWPENEYNRSSTNLKWSNEINSNTKIKYFIESLFITLRNKVLLNNGDLNQTKIIWFYPISMTKNRLNLFKNEWENAYKKYFGDNLNNIISMTESVAPYEYYKKTHANVNNIVTIDIGGGTSDIVIANNGTINCITSFRFAANSIFGDVYVNGNQAKNGIILQFRKLFEGVFKDNNQGALTTICKKHFEYSNSNEIASFFFSLKDNKSIIEENIENNVDFNKILQNDESQKIVFLLFYSALIYHLAQIMKAKEMEMPRHIAFSGNGSRVIKILSLDQKILEKYTKIIFERLYQADYPENGLTILQNENNPKEITCKGGILFNTTQTSDEISDLKVVLKSTNESIFISNETYKDIDDTYIKSVANNAIQFLNFIFDLNKEFSFKNNFGINDESILIAEKICYRDLCTFIKNGLDEKIKEVSLNDIIEETLFFYPINGCLNSLCNEIYNNITNNKL